MKNVSDLSTSKYYTATFMPGMIADLDLMRQNGVKCILRFSYLSSGDVDASKAIILSQIQKLRADITLANEDVISSIEAGFIGRYGEWYYSSNFGTGGRNYFELPANSTKKQDRIDIGAAIIGNGSTTGLTNKRMVAFRTPYFQQIVTASVISSTPYGSDLKARTAAHDDCFQADNTDMGTFETSPLSIDQDYLENQSKYTFTGGETCMNAPNSPYYVGSTVLTKMAKYHFSYLNGSPDHTGGTSPIDYWNTSSGGNILGDIKTKLGYRYYLKSSDITSAGLLTLKFLNHGFANLANFHKMFLVLKRVSNGDISQVEINPADIRLCNAGATTEYSITKTLLGMTVSSGPAIVNGQQYSLAINLADNSTSLGSNAKYSIRFADSNTGFWDATHGWNNLLRNITINASNVTRPAGDLETILMASAYPNPFTKGFKFSISTSSNQLITIKVYDMIGMLVDNITVGSTSVPDQEIGYNYRPGVYNVVITQAGNSKSLHIIKK